MSEIGHDEQVLAAKETLKPAMERQHGTYECLLCGDRYQVDGTCPNDGLPLRKVPQSEL